MERKGQCESDRLTLEIPIEVVGTDSLGAQFFDRTYTLVIGRHGGKIALRPTSPISGEGSLSKTVGGRKPPLVMAPLLSARHKLPAAGSRTECWKSEVVGRLPGYRQAD